MKQAQEFRIDIVGGKIRPLVRCENLLPLQGQWWWQQHHHENDQLAAASTENDPGIPGADHLSPLAFLAPIACKTHVIVRLFMK